MLVVVVDVIDDVVGVNVFIVPLLIGTSMRRSGRSTFGWSTGNDVSGHY